jgi:hypothetical protein
MKYITFALGSMTGVEMIPTVPALLLHDKGRLAIATGVPKFFCSKIFPVTLSTANTLLAWSARYTTSLGNLLA